MQPASVRDFIESLPTPGERRRAMLIATAASVLTPFVAPAHAAVEIEGVELPETITAYGQKLVLNGAGLRKRGYFKADVTALYLPEKRTTADAIYRLNGIRRIQLNILREFTSSTISRIFLSDFKQSATEDEFKKLIGPIGLIGAAYSNVKRVVKGDVVNLDWVPARAGWPRTMAANSPATAAACWPSTTSWPTRSTCACTSARRRPKTCAMACWG